MDSVVINLTNNCVRDKSTGRDTVIKQGSAISECDFLTNDGILSFLYIQFVIINFYLFYIIIIIIIKPISVFILF